MAVGSASTPWRGSRATPPLPKRESREPREVPVAIEVAGRSAEDDLAVVLQHNSYRPLFRVRTDRLANEAAASEGAVEPSASVESSDRDPSADTAADQHPTATLDGDAARRAGAAERGEDTPTTVERRVERTGTGARRG